MAEKKNLTDDQKKQLIEFYKGNPALWDSNNPYNKNKEKREALKNALVDHFEKEFTMEKLESTFHSLRSSMIREVKKNAGVEVPCKKWKFYTEMEFLVNELTKEKKKNSFSSDETEELIDFYRAHPSLWNHTLEEYRDRNLRESYMSKLCDQFDSKFTVNELKTCWHNTVTTYKREKMREESSQSSGMASSEVYYSNWEFYNQMDFIDVTCDVDETVSSLDDSSQKDEPAKKKSKAQRASDEQSAKAELWKALTQSITQKNTNQQEKQGSSSSKNQREKEVSSKDDLAQRAELFGNLVADNLLQCDPKDWTLLKKKVIDLFFDYEQQKQSIQQQFPLQPQPGIFSSMLQQTGNVNLNHGPFSPSSSYSNESFNGN